MQMNNKNPQDIADFLLEQERKYAVGTREDIEDALHLAAVVLEELRPLVSNFSRTAIMRKADENRIVALIGFIKRLTAQLIHLSSQSAAPSTSTQLWQALANRSKDKNPPSGVAKRSNC